MNHSAFSARRPFGRREGGLCPLSFPLSTTFFNPAEFLQAALFQAVFSFRKNGGDLCSTSLILSITFFRFPEILSSRRVKVTMQLFMSAEEVYAPLCPTCQSLSSPFRNTSGIASQSHYSVLYERGRRMLLFSHPVNHFFRPCETLFRLCAVLKSLPLRETRR